MHGFTEVFSRPESGLRNNNSFDPNDLNLTILLRFEYRLYLSPCIQSVGAALPPDLLSFSCKLFKFQQISNVLI